MDKHVDKNNYVVPSIIQQIRNGMLLHKPIIYLKTAELEIVRRVLNSDQTVVRMTSVSADILAPYATRYSNMVTCGPLIDAEILNIKCCTQDELSSYIASIGGDNGDNYGRFVFQNQNWKSHKTSYQLPSILAVRVHKRPAPFNNPSAFDALYPFIDRYVQEADNSCAIRSSFVLLYGDEIELPTWLLTYSYIVEEPYPQREELADVLRNKTLSARDVCLSEETMAAYVSGFLGSTLVQVENIIDYLINLPVDPLTRRPTIENQSIVQAILAELKEQNIKRVGLLELLKTETDEELGGMVRFYQWLDKNRESIQRTDQIYRRTGAAGQKGILMCGIPGCGKSAAVNLLARELRLPVLKMDIGRLMGGIVGESEHNMHLALRLAEAMSPCILYIDEIEKGFSGSNGRSEDTSGVTKRMFGILLSWMQDCAKPVYIFATANSLSGIPKEFFRSGRFDSHFALYMPTCAECIDIFQKRMLKAEKIAKQQDGQSALFMEACYQSGHLETVMQHLLNQRDGKENGRFVTGADITKLVNMALRQFARRTGAINHTEWIAALCNAADETTVYGDGNENLDSIAVCYIRMMRLGFQPTSEGCLFQPQDYHVEYHEENLVPSIIEKDSFPTEYDRVLYHTIRKKMQFLAGRLEENAVADLVR